VAAPASFVVIRTSEFDTTKCTSDREEILQRDTWLQLLGSFVHLQVEVDVDPDTGKKTRSEKVLFPRYHQWRAVTRLVGVEHPLVRVVVQLRQSVREPRDRVRLP
jgi:hypothetical protein